MKVMQNYVLVELTVLKHRLFNLQMIVGAMKTRLRENSPTLQNVHEKLHTEFSHRIGLQSIGYWADIIAMDEMATPSRYHW